MLRSLLVLLALGAGVAQAQPRLIAIANFGEHPALRAAVNGFKAEVVRQGFVEGRDIAFDDQHINFDRTLIPQLLTNAAAKKPALIVAVTTPVAQSSIRVVTDKSIPIVFMSVVDPVVAKIVPSWERGSETHTGATLYPDFDASLAFVRQLLPNAKRLGIPYNPGEDNDISNMKEMRAAAPKHGFAIAEVGIDSPNDIAQRLQSLQGKVDAVFVIQSNILQTSLPVIAAATQRMGVPAINTLDTPVRQHQFLAAHALSYERMGANAGRIAARVLKGEKPAAIPPHRPGPEDYAIVISRKQLAQWKMEAPAAFAKNVID
ncbi:MAG TPA: ABC transporter substrate-binding protein [Burkholderiales bacterium]|jgi:putative ABC transport system substrate-binding protein|nr:ABC transporter substrate-binding protein [Burkholderiales bacterium]